MNCNLWRGILQNTPLSVPMVWTAKEGLQKRLRQSTSPYVWVVWWCVSLRECKQKYIGYEAVGWFKPWYLCIMKAWFTKSHWYILKASRQSNHTTKSEKNKGNQERQQSNFGEAQLWAWWISDPQNYHLFLYISLHCIVILRLNLFSVFCKQVMAALSRTEYRREYTCRVRSPLVAYSLQSFYRPPEVSGSNFGAGEIFILCTSSRLCSKCSGSSQIVLACSWLLIAMLSRVPACCQFF